MRQAPKKQGSKNDASINVREDYEVLYWTKELGIDQRTLTSAVKAVGPSVASVKRYLQAQQALR